MKRTRYVGRPARVQRRVQFWEGEVSRARNPAEELTAVYRWLYAESRRGRGGKQRTFAESQLAEVTSRMLEAARAITEVDQMSHLETWAEM